MVHDNLEHSPLTFLVWLIILLFGGLFVFFGQRICEASHGEALRSTLDLDQSRACDGQFEEDYQPIKAVGKGAFGFVWKAVRRCDGQEVRNTVYFLKKFSPPYKYLNAFGTGLGCFFFNFRW